MSANHEQKIKTIIVEKLEVDHSELTPQASFVELGADSLDIVELVMAFEEEFGIKISDEDFQKVQTVGEIIAFINKAAK
jgi:acyl carrier protein